MEDPEFCKFHNCGARCKFGESYESDGTPFHFCGDYPCLLRSKEVYNKLKGE